MDGFKVYQDRLLLLGDDMIGYAGKINDYGDEIRAVKRHLRYKIVREEQIGARILAIATAVELLSQRMRDMGRAAESISRLYTQTEERISGIGINDKDIYIDSVAFDDEGAFGGNQGSPQSDSHRFLWWAWGDPEIYDLIRKYYPDYSDVQIHKFLKKLNSEGCGYVALINTIFQQYQGRENEFEEIFGFPMYVDGDNHKDLNFDRLLVDFYAATDNHNPGKDGSDSINFDEDISDTHGVGTNTDTREYRWTQYLNDHGVDVKVETQPAFTPENVKQCLREGTGVVVSTRPLHLIDPETGNVVDNRDNGHAMTITGVTKDGMYEVSSWGKKYLLNPNDYADTHLDAVDGKGKHVNAETRFVIQTINY